MLELTPGIRQHVLAIANQKGGVGKTTSAINLAAAVAGSGRRVLLIDIDPQGNASTGLGISKSRRGSSSYDVLIEDAPLTSAIQATKVPDLFICPGSPDLSSSDVDLVAHEKRTFLLRDALRQPDVEARAFDLVIIDCPPSMNLLTVNALVASDAVLVPLQAEFFALEGLTQLMQTIREIRLAANPSLRIAGILITMADPRNKLSQQVEADVRATLGSLVLQTSIPRNVRLSEAPSFGMPATLYDPTSKGAMAYVAAAAELMARQDMARQAKAKGAVI